MSVNPFWEVIVLLTEDVSKTLTEVVPTAIFLFAKFIFLAVLSSISKYSDVILCSAMLSHLTGANVPHDTCNIASAIPTFLFLKLFKISSVKWSPAVGAATEPGLSAKMVWYLSVSISVASLLM